MSTISWFVVLFITNVGGVDGDDDGNVDDAGIEGDNNDDVDGDDNENDDGDDDDDNDDAVCRLADNRKKVSLLKLLLLLLLPSRFRCTSSIFCH